MAIEFDPELQPWAGIIYWFVVINAFACFAFTLVVIVGGINDLRFLFSALLEEEVDDRDDGRVIKADVSSETCEPSLTDS